MVNTDAIDKCKVQNEGFKVVLDGQIKVWIHKGRNEEGDLMFMQAGPHRQAKSLGTRLKPAGVSVVSKIIRKFQEK